MFDFDIAFMYYFNLIGRLLWRFCSMLGAAASEISGGAGVTEVLQKVDISKSELFFRLRYFSSNSSRQTTIE